MKKLKRILISLTFLSATLCICMVVFMIAYSISYGRPLFKTDEEEKLKLASTIPNYDEFLDNYNELYPDGYDSSARWYKYQNITTSYTDDDSEKNIISTEFIGYINFNKNSFDGTVSSFKYTVTKTVFMNGQILYYKSYEAYLNEGKFYCVNKTIDSNDEVLYEKSMGCSDIKYFNLKTSFSSDFYSVDQYLNYINELKYNLIRIYGGKKSMDGYTDGYVTLNINKTSGEYEKQEKTFYYFDENLSVYEISQYKYYINSYSSDNCNIVTPTNLKNVSSVSRLEFDNGNYFTIPTTYDEEYVYDDSNNLIYL